MWCIGFSLVEEAIETMKSGFEFEFCYFTSWVFSGDIFNIPVNEDIFLLLELFKKWN